jgi:hypothetical protein
LSNPGIRPVLRRPIEFLTGDDGKVRKHFDLSITETEFIFARTTDAIEAEAGADGLYTARSYRPLSRVEGMVRSIM